eukprot:m.145211 g.145211  ORF g.145211 m.145211 type:complete len:645 (+) comp30428_c0_seq2:1589-3523(+)
MRAMLRVFCGVLGVVLFAGAGVQAQPCADLLKLKEIAKNKQTVLTLIERGSANIRNSIGNYYECYHPYDLKSALDYQICVSDKLNPSEEFPVQSHGICIPKKYETEFINCLLNDTDENFDASPFGQIPSLMTFRNMSLLATAQHHCGDAQLTKMDTGAIVMASLCGVLALLCIISQLVESYELAHDDDDGGGGGGRSSVNGSQKPKWKKVGRQVLKAFCPSDALSTLMERTPSRPLSGLDGLRSFSMMWIILAHTTLLVCLLGTDDQDALLEGLETVPQQFTLGASLAVDTFFFLSGLLTTYTLLRRMRKGNKNSFPAGMFILLRFLRLTPLYAFILLFYTYIVPHLSSGPVWYRMHQDTALCRDTWWANLLYINDFYPTSFHSTCMSWSWYLANDMQFFILGLLILTIYLRVKWLGIGISVSLAITGVVSGWILLVKHRNDIQDDYYDKPYTRVTPFTIGILLGILFVDHDFINIRLSKMKSAVMMTVSIILILAIVYVDYANFRHPDPKKVASDTTNVINVGDFTAEENAAYQSGGRLVFALAIATLTLLCVTGHGGPINSFLSSGFWEPLGKLTYGAYLVHPVVIRCYYYQKVQLFHFDVFEQSMYFLSISAMSYFIAGVLHVVVELPFANLTKFVIPARR